MIHKLLDSFGALYRLLERPRAARRAVACLLVVHTCLLAYSAYVHSPTLNEPGHLVAGLSHWKFGRFEVYRVNPPLVKMIAALPVMLVGYEEDWSGFYEGPGARPEMAMGEDFVAANGERSFFLFMIARWACIPFSWIGAITCFLWARDLYGRPAGVMACTIWCFEPNILAHASLMTPDIGGTALGVAACYTFWRWLKNPTWTQAALTGVVLGLAELCKTTLILFYPLWPILWVVYRLLERRSRESRVESPGPDENPAPCEGAASSPLKNSVAGVCDLGIFGKSPASQRPATVWLREAGMLALRMVIGLYILNLGYGFEGTGTRLGDFHFVSDMLTGREPRVESQEPRDKSQEPNNPQSNPSFSSRREPSTNPTNRFTTSWWGVLPVPLPKNYVLGIDIQQKDFEHYGRPSYLRGEWRDHGWWYYYLYAAAIKVPLALWALAALTLCLHFLHNPPPRYSGEGLGEGASTFRDTLNLLTPPLVIFSVASAKTGFSEHFRYVLPCFPFLFIWLSQTARLFQSVGQAPPDMPIHEESGGA